jgi:hypothetical protein
MNAKHLFLGIAAGLASAIVFASAGAGPMLSRMVLFLLTPFPIYLAGLGLGLMPAVAGVVAACLLILALSNVLTVFTYAAGVAVPALILTRLTLLARTEGEVREWYPIGRVVIAAALMSGAMSFAYMAAQGADTEALTKMVRPAVDEFAKTQLPSLPGGETLGEPQIVELTNIIVTTLPGAIAISVMLTALASLWLAGRVALAAGMLQRPWPDFTRLELPLGSAILLLVTMLVSITSDKAWLLADGFASALRFAFALLGLAVVHHFTRGSSWRGFILFAVYTGLLILAKHTLLILTIIGLAETVFHYRYAAQRPPPPAPPAP